MGNAECGKSATGNLRNFSVESICIIPVVDFPLSSSTHNPAYNSVFNCKFKRSFDLKPNQMPLWAFDCNWSYKPLDLRKRMYCAAQSHLDHHGFLNDLVLTSACTILAKNLPLWKYFVQNIMRYMLSIKTTANSIQMDL